MSTCPHCFQRTEISGQGGPLECDTPFCPGNYFGGNRKAEEVHNNRPSGWFSEKNSNPTRQGSTVKNFKLIDFHTDPVNIDRGEAINRLIDRGIVLDRAVSLIDALPAGVGVVYRDFNGDEYQIVRLG